MPSDLGHEPINCGSPLWFVRRLRASGSIRLDHVRRAFCRRFRAQSTQVSKPRVIVSYETAVKGFEGGRRRLGKGPSSVHQAQQHVNRTSIAMAPSTKWRRPSMLSTKALILSAPRTARRALSGRPLSPEHCRCSNPGSNVLARGTTVGFERNSPPLSDDSAASRSTDHRSTLEPTWEPPPGTSVSKRIPHQ